MGPSLMKPAREPGVDIKAVRDHHLSDEEYDRIRRVLGRAPMLTELGIFSVMFSEHCSYKSSKKVLKLLPTQGPHVLVGPGEGDAGVISLGDGWAVVFKMESHNHPSAVEPFQGAATGVGGILRDIFTMGARPILLMDSLRFGRPQMPEVRRLVKGVVAGISHYGNCVGVPTLGGELKFDPSYDGNPLVNVMALGIVRVPDLIRARAAGAGNPVYYVGAATGRDGLGGASFASRLLTEQSQEDRPAVQVGDPFYEKMLLEACLEAVATGSVVSLKDMGAAGLTCSSCESAASGGVGMELDLSRVPLREPGMTPYEIMLSESQERMLFVIDRQKEAAARRVFEKWELPAIPIGTITSDGVLRVSHQGQVVAEIPARALADEGPSNDMKAERPAWQDLALRFDPRDYSLPKDPVKILKGMVENPNAASKRWVFEQYDHMVQINGLRLPGQDAAVVRLKESGKALAVTVDGNGAYCFLDPCRGTELVVAEAARNLAAVGADPLGVTDGLNFGDPNRPEVFWQFSESIQGLSKGCRALGIPVVSGNVSFYNESPNGAIDPTPLVGMVGVVRNPQNAGGIGFQRAGDLIYVVGSFRPELSASLYLRVVYQQKRGAPPALDWPLENRVRNFVIESVAAGQFSSCHDLSDGGLGSALVESCLASASPLGARVAMPRGPRWDQVLWGETASAFLISIERSREADFIRRAASAGIEVCRLGEVQAGPMEIEELFQVPLDRVRQWYERGLTNALSVED